MLSGSNARPVFVALGAATVITLGAVATPATALAADPSPTAADDPAPDPSGGSTPSDSPSNPPSDSPSDPPPASSPPVKPAPPPSSPPYQRTPSLSVHLSFSAAKAAPGGSVTATARVSAAHAVAHHAMLRFSATGASVVSGLLSLGDVSAARSASAVVKIPAGHAAGTVTVTASLSADRASTHSDAGKITVTGSGSSVGASAAGADLPSSALATGLGLPDQTATAGAGPAGAQLPLIAGQAPAVAPDQLPAVQPVSLRTKTSPLGLDATSYRLLWTQVAWLTALLVGISLLLTQLRLNRRRPARPATRRSRS
ncbi:hypothetical protein [Actinoallomurus iriomotensis]|uniref:Uncharacterized protein n=1 Tax=Actinoallomurus iriomotensis TaxID=478107 RepID=A0A9W6VWL9_9ACTN|nr:hypothetical protein [Actinoallomurus iriomotensis]GLY80916.1 hypothetical protein Airi01_091830 [Actinoallomurus iriomotensis]